MNNIYHNILYPAVSTETVVMASMTTVNVTGTLTVPNGAASNSAAAFGQLQAITGVSTGIDAAAGTIGEPRTASTQSLNAPGNAQFFDCTGLTLTAGRWTISGIETAFNNGATWNSFVVGTSTTSGNTNANLVIGQTENVQTWANSSTTPTEIINVLTPYTTSFATTTTYWLKSRLSYSAGTPQIEGCSMTAVRR
jgi:hypothetical protein